MSTNGEMFRCKVQPVPDTDVFVRELSVAESDEFGQLGDDAESSLIGWALLCACDKDGKRLFGRDDHDRLRAAPFVTMKRIAEAAMEVNGAVLDLAKNFETTPDGDSATG